MTRPVRFAELAQRLLDRARPIGPSRLARLTFYTQPHWSNVLAGRRPLTIESADALMLGLHLSVEDLLEPEASARDLAA